MQNKDRFNSEDEATKAWSLEVIGGSGNNADDLSFFKWLFKECDTKSASEKRIKPGDLFLTEHGTSISAVRTNDEKRTVIFRLDRVRNFGNYRAEEAFGKECSRVIDWLCEYLNFVGKEVTPDRILMSNLFLEKELKILSKERDTFKEERDKALEELNELKNRGITSSGSYVKLEYHEEVKKEMDRLRSENESMSKNLAALHDADDKLTKSDMACTAWMNQAKATQKKLAQVEKELSDAKRAYDELKGDYLVSEERLKKFKDMELSLATKENYEREIKILEQQKKDKDVKFVELSENFEVVKSERDKLRLMLGEESGTLAGARKNAELFERERNEARAKLEDVEKRLASMRLGRDERQRERDAEREKVRKLRKRVEELEASNDSALKHLNGAVPKVAEIIKERDELKFKMAQIKLLV